MTYQKEFPDFVLDVQLPEGFEDTSWHNNICPSFKRGDVEIFVDYADTALRELPDSPRFSVQRFDAKADATKTSFRRTTGRLCSTRSRNFEGRRPPPRAVVP